ncbi:homocysteine S-methyltransferase family protein [Planctomycetes bacterium K23_9]|uniref:Homocysteine S-methyltransferase n=1 Tax=Stieleria marina TaxID=1930275 RepID=A0A517NZ50_9BACT|nr:Homocysteine S-methyltransferase [Planctomycetes bacterium K23_9]
MSKLTILDGPVGTQLDARGISIDGPKWSAAAIAQQGNVIADIHRDYAAAGATIHTANTFRTKRRSVGDRWKQLTAAAIQMTRQLIGTEMRVAGSIAPLQDCYRRDLSPADSDPKTTAIEHREMAMELAQCGCDLLLCETFPHPGEALIAVQQAVQTGKPTWLSLSAGPDGDLLTPAEVAQCARRAVDAGVEAVLVNCIGATWTLPFVEAIARANLGVPIGAYANAGRTSESIPWNDSSDKSTAAYRELAKTWVDAGATILGGCCGTTPAHTASLQSLTT